MGETRYAINIPNVALPPVNWDYVPPFVVLQQLCDSLGCCISYRLDNDSVLISRIRVGGALPPGSISTESPTIDSPERPDSIVLVGAPVRFQARFLLEPVGLDWDKLWRPIDALSYRPEDPPDPENPWRYSFPPGFGVLPETDRLTRFQAQDL